MKKHLEVFAIITKKPVHSMEQLSRYTIVFLVNGCPDTLYMVAFEVEAK
jgi:hypothetical protein